MPDNDQDFVEFTLKPGVTFYADNGLPYPPGSTVRLPREKADQLAHLAAQEVNVNSATLNSAEQIPAIAKDVADRAAAVNDANAVKSGAEASSPQPPVADPALRPAPARTGKGT